MNLSRVESRADTNAALAAAAAATVIITLQLASKATRDALFLSSFGVAALPPMVIAAAILSVVLTVMLARMMVLTRPAALVPRLFALSCVLLLAEWALVGPARRPAAILVYLHFSALGAVLVSGFWAIINERFDPRSARRTIARITAGGSLGGLLGGLLPERVGSTLPLTTMLPILALLTLLASGLVLAVEHGATPPPMGDEEAGDTEPMLTGSRVLRNSSYLTSLALLVTLTSSAEAVLDYVFKARASAATTTGEELLRFFAAFYTATALVGLFIQVTALRSLLGRLGIARSASLLPAGVSAGAVGALLVPGLLSVVMARGIEVVVRSSLFRAAYELLFTPVAPPEKRATKLLLDVGAARVGDVVGGTLILGTLALTAGGSARILLVLTFVLSAMALAVARRLHRGYVAALEGSLHRRAGELPDALSDDAGALLQTVGGFDLSGIRTRTAFLTARPGPTLSRSSPEPAAAPSVTPPESPLIQAIRSGKPAEVRRALADFPLTPDQVESAVELLAWDAVAPAAVAALRAVASSNTRLLLEHLLDPDEDFAIRRRLVNVLAGSRSREAFEGLAQALNDRRFEVRYRAGRALSQMAGQVDGARIDRERVVGVILNEMGVDRGVWESRQLIDPAEEEYSPMEAEVLRDRVSRSMEHLFTLLSLIYPRETLRLAFHALHTNDPYLRGTALEYLETVLPDTIWGRLLPLLEQGEVPTRLPGSADALRDLLASRESISLALSEARRQERLKPSADQID
jgi:ATP:ADP antiporter, AAA family